VAQNFGIVARAGLPLKPFFLFIAMSGIVAGAVAAVAIGAT